MAKRNYTKKNQAYWEGKKNLKELINMASKPHVPQYTEAYSPQWDAEISFAEAACEGRAGGGTTFRDGFAPGIMPLDQFRNIDAIGLPWQTYNGYWSANRAILLCQKAYAGVPIVRNAVESAVEFSNSDIFIETENETAKKWFIEWFNAININKLKDNILREYFKSGNVFIYQFDGKILDEDYGQMQQVMGAKSAIVPIRYTILNPAQVSLQNAVALNQNYVIALSQYEIEKLRNPKTDYDKQVYNDLPPEVKNQIKEGAGQQVIYMPLDPKRLTTLFYKKQDYEPLAIPMIYPVLPDVEWKLELKKMDMTVAKMIEHAILLITAGHPADEHNPKYNPQNLVNLTNIFKNQTLGRVLVADHTVKAQWVIPDIGKILGKEKYEQVENDIKDGLQSIIMGEDKFANAQIKARVFIERMKEGQRAFLNFLMPQIQKICKQMNFKNVPIVKFAEIDLNDPTAMNRVYLRLAELGLITADEVNHAITTGILPSKTTSVNDQKEYKKLRDQGLYEPLIGGAKKDGESGGNGRPVGTGTPKTTNPISPIGQGAYSGKKVIEILPAAQEIKDMIVEALKKKYKLKELDQYQLSAAETLTKSLITREKKNKWKSSIGKYLKELPEIDERASNEIDEIAATHGLSTWDATIVYLAKIEKNSV